MATFVHPLVYSIEKPLALTVALVQLAVTDVIVAPTDTVYGVMCRFDQPQAIDKLYEIKARPPVKAIPILISQIEQLSQLTPMPLSPIVQALAEAFWPGPLTIVLPALPTLPAILTAQQPTVGVRLPNHTWLRALIDQSGPLAATSANRSGQAEAHTVAEVLTQLQDRVRLVLADLALDQADSATRLASTVVSVTDHQSVQILRAGPIAERVKQFLQDRFALSC
jgi:L-threonylcarbamoyladenylate synthase